MNATDFTAWLGGFADAVGPQPAPEQWATIKEKLSQVSRGAPFGVQIPRLGIAPAPLADRSYGLCADEGTRIGVVK